MIKKYLSLVKFSHTVFALPFAVVGFCLAAMRYDAWSWKTFGLVLLCMVFARNTAMAFNRYLDRDIDAKNERTRVREIPAGILSPKAVLFFIVLNAVLFVLVTWFINPLCFALSPVALAVVMGYSYTKRFTALCHLVLGLGLALAPLGAYLAAGGGFDLIPLLYSLLILSWVSGFDIIYALQDADFDASQDLYSIPARLGKQKALAVSKILHLVAALALCTILYLQLRQYTELSFIHVLGGLVFLLLLVRQHTLVSAHDLSRVNMAFFTTNGIASVVYGAFFLLDVVYTTSG